MTNEQLIHQLASDPEVRRMAILGAQTLLNKLVTAEAAVIVAEAAVPARRGRPPKAAAKPKTHRLSAAGRAAISAAAKKRWAKIRRAAKKAGK